MVEHAFVTATRLSEYRGLAGAYSNRMHALAAGDESTRRVDALAHDAALVEGLRQLSYTGRAAGIDAAHEGIRGPLSYAAAELAQIREPGTSPEERDAVAERLLETFRDRLYRPVTAERHIEEEMDLPFQSFGTVVPNREGPVVDDSATDDEEEDDSTSLLGLLVWLPFWLPFLPIILAGYDDTLETFFEPFPDGPYELAHRGYPLLLPAFLLWALTRAVTRRLGVWESLADAGRGAYDVVSVGADWCRDAVGTVRERVGGAMNPALPGEWELTASTLFAGIGALFLLPYEVVTWPYDGDPFDDFYWWASPLMNRLGELSSVLVGMVLLVVLFPVFVLWLFARTVARTVGVWDRIVAGARNVWERGVRDTWERGVRLVRRLRRLLDPTRILDWLRSTWRRLWNRLAYATRRGVRRARGDDWRSSLPSTADPERIERGLETAVEEMATATEGSQAPDASASSERASDADADVDTEIAATDLSERLLAGSSDLTTESPGDVSVVSVGEDANEESVLDDALRDLSRLDRCTTSELQARRAARDERTSVTGASEAVFEAMRERGLDETIHELFAHFPPEERRE
jgi:hypothetical protein